MPQQSNEISLTKTQLDEISRLAALLISPNDIATWLDLDEKQFAYEISMKTSEISRAFRKGHLKTLIKSREKLFYEFNMEQEYDVDVTIPEEKATEISQLLDDFGAIIQTDINNAETEISY